MNPCEITVRKQGSKLYLDKPVFDFKSCTEVTWAPETSEDVQDIAIVVTAVPPGLPVFKKEVSAPKQVMIRVTGSPKGTWQYLIKVDDQWFSKVNLLGDEFAPEEPPELQNPPG